MGEAKQLCADRCRGGVTSCIDPMQLCETPNLDCLGPTKPSKLLVMSAAFSLPPACSAFGLIIFLEGSPLKGLWGLGLRRSCCVCVYKQVSVLPCSCLPNA